MNHNQRGEITILLTIISFGFIIAGIVAGSKLAQSGPRFTPFASGNTYSYPENGVFAQSSACHPWNNGWNPSMGLRCDGKWSPNGACACLGGAPGCGEPGNNAISFNCCHQNPNNSGSQYPNYCEINGQAGFYYSNRGAIGNEYLGLSTSPNAPTDTPSIAPSPTTPPILPSTNIPTPTIPPGNQPTPTTDNRPTHAVTATPISSTNSPPTIAPSPTAAGTLQPTSISGSVIIRANNILYKIATVYLCDIKYDDCSHKQVLYDGTGQLVDASYTYSFDSIETGTKYRIAVLITGNSLDSYGNSQFIGTSSFDRGDCNNKKEKGQSDVDCIVTTADSPQNFTIPLSSPIPTSTPAPTVTQDMNLSLKVSGVCDADEPVGNTCDYVYNDQAILEFEELSQTIFLQYQKNMDTGPKPNKTITYLRNNGPLPFQVDSDYYAQPVFFFTKKNADEPYCRYRGYYEEFMIQKGNFNKEFTMTLDEKNAECQKEPPATEKTTTITYIVGNLCLSDWRCDYKYSPVNSSNISIVLPDSTKNYPPMDKIADRLGEQWFKAKIEIPTIPGITTFAAIANFSYQRKNDGYWCNHKKIFSIPFPPGITQTVTTKIDDTKDCAPNTPTPTITGTVTVNDSNATYAIMINKYTIGDASAMSEFLKSVKRAPGTQIQTDWLPPSSNYIF